MTDATTTPSTAVEPATRAIVRAPTYLFRLLVGLVVLLVGIVICAWFDNTAAALNVDWERMTDRLPSWLQALPVVITVAVLLLAPVVVNALVLYRRRFRLFLMLNAAAVSALVLSDLLVTALTQDPPIRFPGAYSVAGDVVSPNDGLLAASMAALVIGLPYLGHGLRRLAYGAVVLNLLGTLGFAETPAVAWVLDLGMGITCGAAVALIFGTPDSKPLPSEIMAALQRSGLAMASVEPAAVDARGSTPWFGVTRRGRRLFIKVLNQDNRSAELMFRITRALTFRDTGDERPASSLRRSVEHEALLSLRATAVGIRTPPLQAVCEIGNESMLLAYEAIDGASLDSVPPEALTDQVLDAIWALVVELRHAGIAHRDLRLANVFLADDGIPQLIDFGFAELAASPLLLATDLAEVVASTSTQVGVTRAVDAAERAVGPDGLAEALTRLQPFALGSATRTAVKEQGLLEPLREEMQRRAGVEEVTYEELAPVRPGAIVGVLVTAVAFWVAVPILTDATGSWSNLVGADLGWVLLAVLASALTYAGATLSTKGSLHDALPTLPTFESRLATSFANRITPARSGGVALSVRYLQKEGVETGAALAAVGLTTTAGAAVHLVVLYMTVRLSGEGGSFDVSTSASGVILIVVAVAIALAGLVMLLPWGRRLLLRTLLPAVRRSATGLRDAAARPRRLVQLLAGSLLVTFAYIAALIASVRALEGTVDVPSIALVFLVASVLAAVAPTPGGLVAMEAALIGGLVLVGEPVAIAIPAVFVYRLVTFWLPVPPGWLAYRRLEAAGRI